MATTTRMTTVEDLERHGVPEGRWELIDGELVELPLSSEQHWTIGSALIYRISAYVVPRQLGLVLTPDAAVVLSTDPPVMRVPDGGFIRADRLPADRDRRRFLRVVPDLVVEIISPNDRAADVIAKGMMWLEAGVTLFWLVDSDGETVTVFERGRGPRTLTVQDTLDGSNVLPGFELAVRDVFSA
ncbi:MAG: Uma2 family endonuclease [Chloroflexota bacterium]|nr:Uma2 family endonuclease [Chloroflexota bacterium]